MQTWRGWIGVLSAGALALGPIGMAQAQDGPYPSKPVRIISCCVGVIDAHHGSNLVEFIASLKRIRACDAEYLLPSHGPIFRKDNALLDATIARLERYTHMADFGTCAVEQVLHLHAHGGGTTTTTAVFGLQDDHRVLALHDHVAGADFLSEFHGSLSGLSQELRTRLQRISSRFGAAKPVILAGNP